jgi:ribonuclease HI
MELKKMKEVIYTDGSCSKNPDGVGAWSYVVMEDKKEKKRKIGRENKTTSNRMELRGILEALRDYPEIELICSDSQYAVNCCGGKWKAKANIDLILEIKTLLKGRDILKWVRGHSGILGNELADQYCEEEMRGAFFSFYGFKFVSHNYKFSKNIENEFF